MTISAARKKFRLFLLFLLVSSGLLFALTSALYMSVRSDIIKIETISPMLFDIDVLWHQTHAHFSDEEAQHNIAKNLYYKGIFNKRYRLAGYEMMDKLAKSGHAPSQIYQGDIILERLADTAENTEKAYAYYAMAANQGYPLAIERLENLNK